MKVLLSAYACEPGKGSEPGLGWHWAIGIARRGHAVHVITRASNRDSIEAARSRGEVPDNLAFHYHDLPRWQRLWKRGQRGVHLYAILWQWGAAHLALRLHARERFDLVHHVTFASLRFPSFMGRLGIPFILGPVGGSEIAPHALRRGYALSGKFADAARDISNRLIRIDPLMRRTFASADQIWLRGRENRALIPAQHAQKIRHHIGLGVEPETFAAPRPAHRELRLLYVGRCVHWKGMHLGLPAFAQARQQLQGRGIHARLTLVGDGPALRHWHADARRLGLGTATDWISPMPQSELACLYASHDLLLFPSLHDSAGMVILEAAAAGTPTLCLDLGGPGALVTDTVGIKASARDRSQAQVVAALAAEMVDLATNPARRHALSASARLWAQSMSWDAAVATIYAPLEHAIVAPVDEPA